jgi:nicotinamide riboside kinase
MDIDIPWTNDPQRDRGERRPEMHALFEEAVQGSGVQYVLISGDGERRFAAARQATERLLSTARA